MHHLQPGIGNTQPFSKRVIDLNKYYMNLLRKFIHTNFKGAVTQKSALTFISRMCKRTLKDYN
jgi:hypothetical protein